MSLATEYDCRSCGLCCVSIDGYHVYASVDAIDLIALDPRWTAKHVELSSDTSGEILTKEHNDWIVCSALRGTPERRVSCTIYDRRPGVCRQLVPGSKDCRDTIEAVRREQR